jgi:hypothetical protein
VSEPANPSKRALECMRLAADCLQLADEVHIPTLQRHFLRMARVWRTHAEQGRVADKSFN